MFERNIAPMCDHSRCAINADCYEYFINLKQRISECRCRGTMGKTEYWEDRNGADGQFCNPVVGIAKGHTWLPHDTNNMVESFIELYLDEKFYLTESGIKNFGRKKKTKAIHDFALRLSITIKVVFLQN